MIPQPQSLRRNRRIGREVRSTRRPNRTHQIGTNNERNLIGPDLPRNGMKRRSRGIGIEVGCLRGGHGEASRTIGEIDGEEVSAAVRSMEDWIGGGEVLGEAISRRWGHGLFYTGRGRGAGPGRRQLGPAVRSHCVVFCFFLISSPRRALPGNYPLLHATIAKFFQASVVQPRTFDLFPNGCV